MNKELYPTPKFLPGTIVMFNFPGSSNYTEQPAVSTVQKIAWSRMLTTWVYTMNGIDSGIEEDKLHSIII